MSLFNIHKKGVVLKIILSAFFIASLILLLTCLFYSGKTVARLKKQITDLAKNEKKITKELRDELTQVYKMKNAFQYFTGLPLATTTLQIEYISDSIVTTEYPPPVYNDYKKESLLKEMFKTTYKDIAVRLTRKTHSSYVLESRKVTRQEPIMTQTLVFPESVSCNSVKWGKSPFQYVPEGELYFVDFSCSTALKTYSLRQCVSYPSSYGMGGLSGLLQININKH